MATSNTIISYDDADAGQTAALAALVTAGATNVGYGIVDLTLAYLPFGILSSTGTSGTWGVVSNSGEIHGFGSIDYLGVLYPDGGMLASDGTYYPYGILDNLLTVYPDGGTLDYYGEFHSYGIVFENGVAEYAALGIFDGTTQHETGIFDGALRHAYGIMGLDAAFHLTGTFDEDSGWNEFGILYATVGTGDPAHAAQGIFDGSIYNATGIFDGSAWYANGIFDGTDGTDGTRYATGIFDGSAVNDLTHADVSSGGTLTLPAGADVQSGAAAYGVGGSSEAPSYPLTADSFAAGQADQLATDQAEVTVAVASINDDTTLLTISGTQNIATIQSDAAAAQLATDQGAVSAVVASITTDVTDLLGEAGTLDMSLYTTISGITFPADANVSIAEAGYGIEGTGHAGTLASVILEADGTQHAKGIFDGSTWYATGVYDYNGLRREYGIMGSNGPDSFAAGILVGESGSNIYYPTGIFDGSTYTATGIFDGVTQYDYGIFNGTDGTDGTRFGNGIFDGMTRFQNGIFDGASEYDGQQYSNGIFDGTTRNETGIFDGVVWYPNGIFDGTNGWDGTRYLGGIFDGTLYYSTGISDGSGWYANGIFDGTDGTDGTLYPTGIFDGTTRFDNGIWDGTARFASGILSSGLYYSVRLGEAGSGEVAFTFV